MVFKKTVKNTNTTTEEYTVEQERYLEYHSAKYNISKKWKWFFFFFVLVGATLLFGLPSISSNGLYVIFVILIYQIVYVIWTMKYDKSRFKLSIFLVIFAWMVSYFFRITPSSPISYQMTVAVFTFAFILIFPLLNSSYENRGVEDAKKILPYMKDISTTEHTAVIFPHNKNRPADGGDGVALKLLEGLEKYKEEFQIYFCLTSEEMIRVLTNPLVKRIWVFGHGKKGGCSLTDGLFTYSEFMLERTEKGWEQRKITPKEYVYQCHCNREKLRSLADYLVHEKGVLDSSVDNMPNYFDTGFSDMDSVSLRKYKRLYVAQKISKVLTVVFKKDVNYMADYSAEYVIDCYLTHLEKKQKISE